MGDLEAVVRGDDLAPTTRSVAFASWATNLGQLRYVSPTDPNDLDFFVPRVIESAPLALLGRERLVRTFPERKSGTSIGLFLALKLVTNGSVAVFCGRKDTAANLCATAADLYARGYAQPPPLPISNAEEAEKISRLFANQMGEEASATRSSALAIFPHHANVPHGLRLSVEHAMKEGHAKLVICTSTLAQGVNLPIKYLIITGVYQGADRILVRDFHNLIGRAGRAGMHTEGSVIFSQNDIYDDRLDITSRWRWLVAQELLNPANSEPSASSLQLLFVPFVYGRPAQGASFFDLHAYLMAHDIRMGRRRPKVEDVVGMCEGGFGYDGAMLLSTIADLVEPLDEILSEAITVIHKQLKYGLASGSAIAFHEIGFADRVVSTALATAFPDVFDRVSAVEAMRQGRGHAETLIEGYPSYFKTVLLELLS